MQLSVHNDSLVKWETLDTVKESMQIKVFWKSRTSLTLKLLVQIAEVKRFKVEILHSGESLSTQYSPTSQKKIEAGVRSQVSALVTAVNLSQKLFKVE